MLFQRQKWRITCVIKVLPHCLAVSAYLSRLINLKNISAFQKNPMGSFGEK